MGTERLKKLTQRPLEEVQALLEWRYDMRRMLEEVRAPRVILDLNANLIREAERAVEIIEARN